MSAAAPLPFAGSPVSVSPGAASPHPVERRARSRDRIPAIDPALLHGLAVHAIDSGREGLAAIGFAAVLHGEGATSIACGMAACVAATLGQRVVLVDANLRSPKLRQLFALEPGPGLSEVLAGTATLESALRAPQNGPSGGPAGSGRLLVLPASHDRADHPGALVGPAMRDLIAALHGYAEMLVFDGAPLHLYPDSTLLARHLDATVVVLQAERARWDTSEAAVQALRDSGARVLGAVLNRRRSYIPRLLERLL